MKAVTNHTADDFLRRVAERTLQLLSARTPADGNLTVEALWQGLARDSDLAALQAFTCPVLADAPGKGGAKAAGPVSDAACLQRLRETYQEIINALKLNGDDHSLARVAQVEKEIRRIRAVDEYARVSRAIIDAIQEYITRLNGEREQAASFIREISASLVEVESHFVYSLSETRQVYNDSSRLGVMLEDEVSDLSDSINVSSSLAELKGLVVSRLAKIKEILAEKAREDQARQEALFHRAEAVQHDFEKMKKETAAANARARRLEKELLQDPLTGIYNRRAYDRRVAEEFSRFQRYGSVFSLLLFDVDHFKAVNDRFGHVVGDKVLKNIVSRIRPVLRQSDFMARFGGEEFVVLLPETHREGAQVAAEKLRRIVETAQFRHQKEDMAITISVGVTEAESADRDVEALFHRMDMAMYEAKNSGRNRVVAK